MNNSVPIALVLCVCVCGGGCLFWTAHGFYLQLNCRNHPPCRVPRALVHSQTRRPFVKRLKVEQLVAVECSLSLPSCPSLFSLLSPLLPPLPPFPLPCPSRLCSLSFLPLPSPSFSFLLFFSPAFPSPSSLLPRLTCK